MDKIDDIICNVFKLTEDELVDEATMEEIDYWDSLTHMELITILESEFCILFSGDNIADMLTLGKIREITKLAIKEK